MAHNFYPSSVGDYGINNQYSPYIQDTDLAYPFNTADGIDLRNEMYRILYGDGSVSPKGYWAIYRRFDITRHSEYWDEKTSEAVGGPAYEYIDEPHRTRNRLVSKDSSGIAAGREIPPGDILIPYRIYYFVYNVNPKAGDQVFEISWDHTSKPENLLPTEYTERYDITLAYPFRLDGGGRIEYWYCVTERSSTKW